MLLFQFIPIIIYSLLVLVTFLFYLVQGYIVQLDLIKVLYGVSFVGILSHVPALVFYLKGKNYLEKWRKVTVIFDVSLLSSIIYFAPSGYNLIFIFLLLFVFYVGLYLSFSYSLFIACVLFFVSTFVLVIKTEMTSFPLMLNILVLGASLFMMVGLSLMVSQIFGEQKDENLYLEALNESVFQGVPVGLLVTQSEGESVYFNSKLEEILSVFNSSQWKENIYNLFPEVKSLSLSDENFLDLIRKNRANEFTFLRVFKRQLEVKKFSSPLYLFVFENRTRLEKAEQSRRQSEKMAAIGTLAAGIAHEIRNPLTGMSGALQMLAPAFQGKDEEMKLTRIVFREIDRLNKLISEFLDYSKPEIPPTDDVDLVKIINEAFGIVKEDPRFIFLKNNPGVSSPPYFVKGYFDQLKQVFLNIFVNAAQAMEDSEHKKIDITLMDLGQELSVKIKDSGIGMDSLTLQKIFEPFHTTKSKGTGLGMAITQKIIQAHKGQIFVESEPQEGTVIELKFPLVQNR